MIVDDEPHVIHVLKVFLEKNNYDVISASNGLEALQNLNMTDPDVIITDVQMPKMTGQELCEKIRADSANAHCRLIVMTSRTDNELRTWAKSFENLEFLEKPLSPRRLVAYLRDYFNSMAA